MELSVLDSVGLPEGSIVSVRSGPTRRQSPMPCAAPFKLPAGPWPLRIDVLALLGKSKQGASLAKLDAEGCCRVPLEARDGRSMSVTLQIFDGTDGKNRPRTAPNFNRQSPDEPEEEASPNSPIRRRDTEAEARAYLDHHRLHEFMHSLFELLLRERPTDPYTFIAVRFREAATAEPRCPGRPNAILSSAGQRPVPIQPALADVPRPIAAAATEETSSHVPDGHMQVTVKSMRGRVMERFMVVSDDKVLAIKGRIQASTGLPVNSQQLMWWGETLPNETTLADHFIIGKLVTLYLITATKEPKLRMSLSGSSDGGLRLWDLKNGELIQDLLVPGAQKGSKDASCGIVMVVDVHWESMRAVSGALSGNLHMWDLNTDGRGMMVMMDGHSAEVSHLFANWKTMQAISGSADGSAKLWDLEKLECLKTMAGEYTIWNVGVDWTNMYMCVGNRTGSVVLWNLEQGLVVSQLETGKAAAESTSTSVASVSLDMTGCRALSGLEDGHLVYWYFQRPGVDNAPTPAPTKVLLAHYSAVRAMSLKWVEVDSRALCGSDDGSLSLWRLDTQECIARFSRHVGFVWAVYADWTKGRALSGAFDGCVKLWDLRTGECLRTIQSHIRPVRCINGGGG